MQPTFFNPAQAQQQVLQPPPIPAPAQPPVQPPQPSTVPQAAMQPSQQTAPPGMPLQGQQLPPPQVGGFQQQQQQPPLSSAEQPNSAFNPGGQQQQPLFYNFQQQSQDVTGAPVPGPMQQQFAPPEQQPLQQQPMQQSPLQQEQQYVPLPQSSVGYDPQQQQQFYPPQPNVVAAPPPVPTATGVDADNAVVTSAAAAAAAAVRPPDILPTSDPFIPSSDRNVFMQTGQLNPEEENRALEQQQQQQHQDYYGGQQYVAPEALQQMHYADYADPNAVGFVLPGDAPLPPHTYQQREPIDGGNEEDARPPQVYQPPQPQQADTENHPEQQQRAASLHPSEPGQQHIYGHDSSQMQQPATEQKAPEEPPIDQVNNLPMDRLVLGQSEQLPDALSVPDPEGAAAVSLDQPPLPVSAKSGNAPYDAQPPPSVMTIEAAGRVFPATSGPPPLLSSQPSSPLPTTTGGPDSAMPPHLLTSTPTMVPPSHSPPGATEEVPQEFVPPASERSEAVGSDRRDESVMGPPPSGPVPLGKRDVTGADTPPMANGLSISANGGGKDKERRPAINSELDDDRDSERSRDYERSKNRKHHSDRRDREGNRQDNDHDDLHHQRRRQRSRSLSVDGEDSSAEDRHDSSRKETRRKRGDQSPPPMQRRGSDRYHHKIKDHSRRDDRRGGRDDKERRRGHRDRDGGDRDRDYREDDRNFKDDRSYYDESMSSRRSESGRFDNSTRYNRSRYDDRSGYYGHRESSRPGSRAGSVYEERFLDRDRYRDNYPGATNHSMLYPGYQAQYPYGMVPGMSQAYMQPQYPGMGMASLPDRATMDKFETHWKYYLQRPVAFEELKSSNEVQYNSLMAYYNTIGDYLKLPPIPQVPKEEEERASSRASVHSGQSADAAATGPSGPYYHPEKKEEPSNSRPESRQALEQSTIYGDPNADPRYQPTMDYGADYDNPASSSVREPPPPTVDPNARITPVKFSFPHVKGCFGALGTFAKVDAKSPLDGQNAVVELHSLQAIFREEAHELMTFPGPLVAGSTHKGEVIQFCQTRIAKAKEDSSDIVDLDSYVLLWELLILLLRQKNAIDGSDIAELLLKDRDVHSPYSSAQHGTDDHENTKSSDQHESAVTMANRTVIVSHDAVSEQQITMKFRDYLLFGHKKEGLEYAMRHGLWGHALFLASKMDERSYSNVMLRFANGLAVNDPLQTLYQSMSGRQPIAVKECAERNWGDWRPHLAMILSNPSNKEGLDGRSIVTLGDTMLNKGFLYASHFCYLMANLEFGTHANTACKMVLIGSDRTQPFDIFATNEAIQCTEIFEYIQKLGNADYQMMPLQYFKFLYAIRMIDVGLSAPALHYLEQIAGTLGSYPTAVQCDHLEPAAFIEQVICLSDRLKYLDPMYTTREGEISEMGDPEWLTAFRQATAQGYGTTQEASTDQQDYATYDQQQQQYYYDQTYQQQQQQQPEGYTNGSSHPKVQGEQLPAEGGGILADQGKQRQEPEFDPTTQEPLMMHPIPEEQQHHHHQPPSPMAEQPPLSEESAQSSAQPSPVKTAGPPPPGGQGGYFANVKTQPPPPPTSAFQAPPASAFKPLPPSISKAKEDAAKNGGPNPNQAKQEAMSKKKDSDKSTAQPGMLGRILGRFIKAPNQMHLPDDSAEQIVWDEDRKCWVDKNADPAEEAAKMVKPPSDMELSSSAGPPAMAAAPPAMGGGPPPVGGNKFSVGGLGKRKPFGRVDVFKNSQSAPALAPQDIPGSAAPSLPPMVPEAAAPGAPPMMFVPTPGPEDQQQQQQPAEPAATASMMFFNPTQIPGGSVAAPPSTS